MMKLLIQNDSSDDDLDLSLGDPMGRGGGGGKRHVPPPPPPAQIGFYPILYVSYNMCSLYKMLAPPARIYDFFFFESTCRGQFFCTRIFPLPHGNNLTKMCRSSPPPTPPAKQKTSWIRLCMGMLTFPNYLKRVICDMVTSLLELLRDSSFGMKNLIDSSPQNRIFNWLNHTPPHDMWDVR